MRLSRTLSVYVGRRFLYWFACVFLSLLALAFVFDLVELLRRVASRQQAGIGIVIQLALLKLPTMAQLLLPFAVLFATMMTFWQLTRSQELVVARAAGVSVWQFLLPALVAAALIGVFRTTLFNPVASVLTQRYEQIEAQIFRGRTSLLAVSESGLWLRQMSERGQAIIHAQGVSQQHMELIDATVFLYEGLDRYTGRIDAASARLEQGYWLLRDALVSMGDRAPVREPTMRIATDLTLETIQDSFAAPETMSFWELPAFIEVLERAGFSAARHRLHLHGLLAAPLMLAAMVLIAATFSLRLVRRGGTMAVAGAGIFVGFLVYFASDLIFALGLSGRLPVELAAWTPASISILLGLAMLLHLEDG
ncbi:MAG: LPS export ABC transporter permease LptG [Alphaproteobacteria bacterium]|nr:LPS export ABC transporter permease LptG [Alphaproteobacteria bacterium]